MSWEARGGRQYFYRVQRDAAGRVRRQYLGRGPQAQAVARELEKSRTAAAQERATLAQLEEALASLAGDTDTFDRAVRDLLEAHLLVTGHYLHCGTWRKSRAKS